MRPILLATILAVLVFGFFPNLDLAVSRLFYVEGQGFPYRNHPVVLAFYNLIKVLSVGTVAGLAGLAVCRAIHGKFPKFRRMTRLAAIFSYRQILFLLLALILGPGLLVHTVIKEVVGRPRPVNIQEFGGMKAYAPPFVIAGDPEGKSFVSGHTAAGFYFTAFGLVAGRAKCRKQLYAGGLVLGTVTAFVRILQGGHFLSDCVFAGLLVLCVNHLLYRWLLGKR